jgi:thiol-disulfide isomerase/thioredoxin
MILALALAVATTACSTEDQAQAGSGDDGKEAAPAAELDKESVDAAARRPGATPGTEPAVDTSALRAAPSWELANLAGETVTNADFHGKIVILDFWATWCGPCKMEIPHFKELYSTYADQGLEIVGVALDREGPKKVAPFVEAAGVEYHTVIGDQQIVTAYGPISGIPTTYVISQDGKIFKRYVGYRPKEVFERDIKTLLGVS